MKTQQVNAMRDAGGETRDDKPGVLSLFFSFLNTEHRTLNTVFLFTFLLLAALVPRAEAATPQQMKITFGGYTNRTEVLTNFPVLVVFTNNVGGSSGFNYSNFLSASGYDLRFATNSTPATDSLNYEIESWNTNGASYVWVQAPTIPTNGTGAIWANWGYPGASSQLPCTTNGAVWTNGYVAVWHMTQTNAQDSTTNRYNGVSTNNVSTNAYVGTGQSFGPTNTLTFPGLTWQPNIFSVSYWLRPNTLVDYNQVIGAVNWSGAWYSHSESGGRCYSGISDASRFSHASYWTAGNWSYFTFTDNANACSLLRNGVVLASMTQFAPTKTWGGFRIGSTGLSVDGIVDEMRISSVASSTNWVWAEYLNMASNTVFNNYGTVAAGNIITVGSTSNGFPNTYVNTTSTWSYTISGQMLASNLTVSVPSPSVFTISSNNVDYGSEVVLTTNASGAVPLTNIWVRFVPTAAVFYSEFITNSSPGATTRTVQVTGLGLSASTPLLTVTPVSLDFGNVITNKTATNMFTVTGANLTNDVIVTAPSAYYELSTNGTDFLPSPVTLATNGSGGIDITNIYVRFTPTAGSGAAQYAGNITNSSAGALDTMVGVSGAGVVQGISVSATALDFGNVITNATSNLTYTVSGSNLEADVTLTVPEGTGFLIKTNGGAGFGTNVTLTVPDKLLPSGGNLSTQTIVVQFAPTAVQAYGPTNITAASTGAASKTTTLNGNGVVPTIYITGGTLDFGSVVTGKFSWIPTSYTVSGSNLSASVTVTAPAGFQVSTNSGSGFGSSLTLNQSGGTLTSRTVYARFLPTLVQSYAGVSITHGSAPAADALQGVTGTGVDYGSKISTGGDTIYVRSVSGVDYCVHVFTNTGAFTPKVPLANVEYLVIGGGGGGGRGTCPGGGGGAGGFVTGTVSIASSASITVGPGGAGGANVGNVGKQGSNSVLAVSGGSTITAYGGGYGSAEDNIVGGSGGCGGGGTYSGGTAGTGSQGKNGGTGRSGFRTSGGGGGAGQVGQNGADSSDGIGGKGGDGTNSTITGSNVWYCGGGAGNNNNLADGSVSGGAGGGGGSYGNANGYDATYYGGGGGGGGNANGNGAGKGYQGIVILRYIFPPSSGTVFLFR